MTALWITTERFFPPSPRAHPVSILRKSKERDATLPNPVNTQE
jgi:hypothetical protein